VLELLGGVAGVVAGLGLGIGVFCVLAWGIRIFSAEDTEWLDDNAGGRLEGMIRHAVRFWGSRQANLAHV
jgi:hypothetical protein